MTEQDLTKRSIDLFNLDPLETKHAVGRATPVYTPLDDRARNLKILLLEPIYPPEAAWGSAKIEQGYLPPIGTISVYNWLRYRGYDVDFIDTQFGDITPEILTVCLREAAYDVVAMPVFTPTAEYVYETARVVRSALHDCKIVLGGIHVTSLPTVAFEQCPECDFVIRHEAEYTFDELLQELADGANDWSNIEGLCYRDREGKPKINRQRMFIGDLDSLPLGFYSNLDLTRYVPHATQYVRLPNYPMMTQRGCPYSCSYCEAATILGKKTRYFSTDRVIEEMKILVNEKGARGVYFQDSTFTIKKAWTMELMEKMIKENLGIRWVCNTRADRVDPELLEAMYKAGGRQIAMGIESANQQSLDVVQKGCTVEQQTQGVEWVREAGFRYVTSYIICLPGETEDMVKNTIDYAKKLRPNIAMFYLPVPFPGSKLYLTCKETGGLRRDVTWSDFIAIDFDNPVYVNPNFTIESMRYWYKRANIEFFLHWRTWMTNLTAIRNFDDITRLARGGRAVGSMTLHGMRGFLKHQYRGFHGQAAPYNTG